MSYTSVLCGVPWRVGLKVGRTIYACRYQTGDVIGGESSGLFVASDDDPLIGMMDTPELARAAVEAHNAKLKMTRGE